MRIVAKKEAIDLRDDPRPTDRVMWNRMRIAAEAEVIHPSWGCKLYQLHREGRIDNDEREAADEYIRVIENHKRLQATDPDDNPDDLGYRRVNKAKQRYNDVREAIGFGRRILDPLLFEEVWPRSPKEHLIVKQCLVILKNFFATGTKRKRKTR